MLRNPCPSRIVQVPLRPIMGHASDSRASRETVGLKVRELIAYLLRRGEMERLVAAVRRERGDIV